MKRVVVTGMGMISPLGNDVRSSWSALISGASGIDRVTDFDTDGLNSKVAGQVRLAEDFPRRLSSKEARRNDPFIHFGLYAAGEALADSRWSPQTQEERERTGVVMGSGIGGFHTLVDGAVGHADQGARSISPFFISAQLINLAAGQIAIANGFQGPNYGVVSACSTGSEAIINAARIIALDEADVMVAGGADAVVHPLAMAGFDRMRALSTAFNDRPSHASRPFDRDRDGFVVADGAAALILESEDHARARGARVYARLIGFASQSDAYHVSASHPDGAGEQLTLRNALRSASVEPADIDYLNAHATSTPVGDAGELAAIRAVFGDGGGPAVSSTKSATGHTLGAAGAIEAIFTVLAVVEGTIPGMMNLENPDPASAGIDLVGPAARKAPVRIALSNSFGFGSTKSALIFAAP